ncbi:MAG: PDZ domain-containing protein [Candidatus Kapabacteria bacterium]|nr:PDZ domain-containing protein [Candidatus Kapabacteria bacterium]
MNTRLRSLFATALFAAGFSTAFVVFFASRINAFAQGNTSSPASSETLLLRQPTVHGSRIAFAYGGDLWTASAQGGEAKRLTSHIGLESSPMYSPDGTKIAFVGEYDGNIDVFVMPSDGGTPTRLTFHPGADALAGWSPDGKSVLVRSSSHSNSPRYGKLFKVSLSAGMPEALPLPMAERGAYSPDGTKLVYNAIGDAFNTWKRYGGGQKAPLRIIDLKTLEYEIIPSANANGGVNNSNDTRSIWLGDVVYFLSDRNRVMNIFAYNTRTKAIEQLTKHTDYDVKFMHGNGTTIAYEQGGRVHVLDVATKTAKPLSISVQADLNAQRARYIKAAKFINNFDISSGGARAVFEARGEILTAPVKKGDIRNLTNTTGAVERSPAWSPDGKHIAYFSDASGEYALHIQEQSGKEKPRVITLATSSSPASFFFAPRWSPDSKKITFADVRLQIWLLDVASGKLTIADKDEYNELNTSGGGTETPRWSPDSRWMIYSKRLPGQMNAVFVYEVSTGKITQITDGMSDASEAVFSRDGKYVFFAASTNVGANVGWLDMARLERPVTQSLYAIALSKDTPSPLAPESDEETVKPASDEASGDKGNDKKDEKKDDKKDDKAAKKDAKPETKIDFTGISQRIVALPVPDRAYANLQTSDGKLFFGEFIPNKPGYTLNVFDMKDRKSTVFAEGVGAHIVSADGNKILYQSGFGAAASYFVVDAKTKPNGSDGRLTLDGMEVYSDPSDEWAQMYQEVWRIQRDMFYDGSMHGTDWKAMGEKYRPWVKHVAHRADLNFVFAELMGELVVGHAYVNGGDWAQPESVPVGLLGADYEVANGFYRIKTIYNGENWNPTLRAPLTQPGVNVNVGDYVLAVNGRPLTAAQNLYSLFEKTADKQTTLTLNSRPSMEGARTVTVVPTSSEAGLRNRAWIENNRRFVDSASKGKLAYVYMPNTGFDGYASFNRYYFSQLDREGVVLDERFNGGGLVADYIIDMLNRPILAGWESRYGKQFLSPRASIYGAKVMIVNEYAGSGGDAMPQYFRRRSLGKLVGKRTWGGLVGISGYPPLMDGGSVTSPSFGTTSPEGAWEVENVGVAPDIDVEMDPKLCAQGRDPQLERAVEQALKELQANPVKRPSRPAPPVERSRQ